MAIDPYFTDALYNKGLAVYKLENTRGDQLYDKVLAMDPNDTDSRNNKGVALHDLGKFIKSLSVTMTKSWL